MKPAGGWPRPSSWLPAQTCDRTADAEHWLREPDGGLPRHRRPDRGRDLPPEVDLVGALDVPKLRHREQELLLWPASEVVQVPVGVSFPAETGIETRCR